MVEIRHSCYLEMVFLIRDFLQFYIQMACPNFSRLDGANLTLSFKWETDPTNRRMKIVTRTAQGNILHTIILEPRWHLLKTGKFASMLRCIGRTRRIHAELCAHATFSF